MLVHQDPGATNGHHDLGPSTSEQRLSLRVEPWHDPVIDKIGHDPRSRLCRDLLAPGSRTVGHLAAASLRSTSRAIPAGRRS